MQALLSSVRSLFSPWNIKPEKINRNGAEVHSADNSVNTSRRSEFHLVYRRPAADPSACIVNRVPGEIQELTVYHSIIDVHIKFSPSPDLQRFAHAFSRSSYSLPVNELRIRLENLYKMVCLGSLV